ncbi:hypothetical protein LEP1GSC021_3292 [Leptospira noguchii str. 1993005606]|nr:hypothetical protein LEP1GSC021_3292 [Leptospira noguchii str. 1993005606]
MLSFQRDLSSDPRSETLSSGERFALVHSSIPFALGRTHVK